MLLYGGVTGRTGHAANMLLYGGVTGRTGHAADIFAEKGDERRHRKS